MKKAKYNEAVVGATGEKGMVMMALPFYLFQPANPEFDLSFRTVHL